MTHLHFIGIGGIGMSGLAAMCADSGYTVTGSDRGAERPENRRIIDALELQGIRIYPQDGSYIRDGRPDLLVYSTAIEEDNADFAAGAGIGRIHRSQLLERVIRESGFECSIAVTGSCGKSTVTAYLAEALTSLGADPSCLDGALIKRFSGGRYAGNYRHGAGKYFVFEADESDKSLVNYSPDYAIILNLGCDHYEKDELVRVFGEFLAKVKKGAVLEREVYELVRPRLKPGFPVRVIDASPRPDSQFAIEEYRILTRTDAIYSQGGRRERLAPSGDRAVTDTIGATNLLSIYGMRSEGFRLESRLPVARFTGGRKLELPQPGFHMAMNALAIDALLEWIGFDPAETIEALERFDGVWRRNDYAGLTASGAAVYDDYAHNPEKIVSCFRAMREMGDGNIYAVFQPHGYAPFGFMRDQLYLEIEPELRNNDRFILLPPYYAGGTSSFKPKAEEVLADWQSRCRRPERFMYFPNRELLTDFLLLQSKPGDTIVIMGARDNSLSDYAASLTGEKP